MQLSTMENDKLQNENMYIKLKRMVLEGIDTPIRNKLMRSRQRRHMLL